VYADTDGERVAEDHDAPLVRGARYSVIAPAAAEPVEAVRHR
jgi:hypothetical protein